MHALGVTRKGAGVCNETQSSSNTHTHTHLMFALGVMSMLRTACNTREKGGGGAGR